MTNAHRLTAAQYEAVRLAASRLSRALEPLPSYIRGAARQAVLTALVTRGYAIKCYLPTHVEYLLTEVGLTAYLVATDTVSATDQVAHQPPTGALPDQPAHP